jgi:anti-sigma regulatory factor (Ser/Thr protein kinase)
VQARSGPTKPEEFRLVLSPDTEAGWRARQALRERFSESLPARTLIDLTAVVTELINNAVAHGPKRPITVTLLIGNETIRGEVADQGNPAAAIPEIGEAVQDGTHGLVMVDKLTSSWAVYEGSTHVWFELPLVRSATRRG